MKFSQENVNVFLGEEEECVLGMCTIVQKSVKKGSRESADRFIDGNLGMNEKD